MSDIKVYDLPLDEKIRLSRSVRYACQSVARIALPKERVSRCLRYRVSSDHDIEVWKHQTTNKAFYAGLIVCGSVWVCPVCAAKISERRRQELQSAYSQHLATGGKVALLTLTFSHKKSDRLRETLTKFGKATEKLRSGKRYDNIRKTMGLIGSVRAFEITYGSNGFHPHTHNALFYTNDVDLSLIEYELKELWKKACFKFGLVTKDQYALTLEDGEKANEYMAKHGTWGIDREMTKSHIKKGKKESITPFDFLRLYMEENDTKYLSLFIEYAQALKRKQQLKWSQGLKDRFIIDEKSDEEVAVEKREDADLLGQLDLDTWRIILKDDKRSYFLDLCEKEIFGQAVDIIKKEFSLTAKLK